MIKTLFLLGSTGSIGKTTLNVVRKNKNKIKIKLLTTNNNIEKIIDQALEFNVKKIVIFSKKNFHKFEKIIKKNKIQVFFSIDDALYKNKEKSSLTINAISGIDGLAPTLNIIKHTKNIAIANKESIICGWKLIKKELNIYQTKFIPLDSEHFSIWSLLKGENIKNVNNIYLTASGGPFLNKNLKNLNKINPQKALKHPNWKMGKKISIDSATMMNKIFEVIEAIKIFNIHREKVKIIIHPKSYIHAIVDFDSGLTKYLSHKTSMEVPISNVMNLGNNSLEQKKNNFDYKKLNGLNFIKPDKNKFPLLRILNNKFNDTYFEIILVAMNDFLVKNFLKNKISYITIHRTMLKLLKKPYLTKYFNTSPKNINEIKLMVNNVEQYLIQYLKKND